MTAKAKQSAERAPLASVSSTGVGQPFLAFDPAELVAVRVRPADFARMMGVSKQAVSDWIKRGVVTLGPDGRLDPSKAARQYAANADPAKMRVRVMKGAMDDVGALKRELRDLRQQLAASDARHAYAMHVDEVEERLARLLDALAERVPTLAEALRLGCLPLALDWLAGRAFRGADPADLAESFGDDASLLAALFGECMDAAGAKPESVSLG